MTLNYEAITAAASLVTALVVAGAVIAESRRHRFATGIGLLAGLHDRFHGPVVREARRRGAKGLATGRPYDVDEVLNFFEMMGLMVRKGALDEDMVWTNFHFWIDAYWQAARQHIDDVRSRDPSIWRELAHLHRSVTEIEKRERRCRDVDLILSTERIKQFLDHEANG